MSKIVVLEDNTLMARIYETKLIKEGHLVGLAFDGQAGLEMIRANKPDLALIDLNLPILSGIEVMKQLRAQNEFFDLPVIAYSGDENLLQAAKTYNPTGTFLKTELSLKEVVESVKNALAATQNKKFDKSAVLDSNALTVNNAENQNGAAAECKKILIADDDPTIALIVRQVVESIGCQAVIAADGREAQQILAKDSDFVAFICDVEMPYLKGYEVVQYMRDEKRLSHIPVMMMASEHNLKVRLESFNAGAILFLPKPFTRKRLESILVTMVNAA